MAAHVVATVDDLPPGTHRVVTVGNLEIGIFNVHGQYYALPNVCVHQWGPLCSGRVSGTLIATADTGWQRTWVRDGEIVICPWHSMEFDIATGQCLGHPRIRLRRYATQVQDGKIMVVLDDPRPRQ